jgi:hypothetical protein
MEDKYFCKFKDLNNVFFQLAVVAQVYNPSNSEGRDQEDQGSRPG